MKKLKIHGVELYNSTLYITHIGRNGDIKRGLPVPNIEYHLKDLEFEGSSLVLKHYELEPSTEYVTKVFSDSRFSKYFVYDNSKESFKSLYYALKSFQPKYEFSEQTWKLRNPTIIRTATVLKSENITNVEIVDHGYIFNIVDVELPEPESKLVVESELKVLRTFFKIYNPILKKRVGKLVKDLMFNLRYGNPILNNIKSFKLGNLYNYQLMKNSEHDSEDPYQPLKKFILGYAISHSPQLRQLIEKFELNQLIEKVRKTLINLEIANGFSKEYNISVKELIKNNTTLSPEGFLKLLIESYSDTINLHSITVRESQNIPFKKC